jgi:hypothetical protein
MAEIREAEAEVAHGRTTTMTKDEALGLIAGS